MKICTYISFFILLLSCKNHESDTNHEIDYSNWKVVRLDGPDVSLMIPDQYDVVDLKLDGFLSRRENSELAFAYNDPKEYRNSIKNYAESIDKLVEQDYEVEFKKLFELEINDNRKGILFKYLTIEEDLKKEWHILILKDDENILQFTFNMLNQYEASYIKPYLNQTFLDFILSLKQQEKDYFNYTDKIALQEFFMK